MPGYLETIILVVAGFWIVVSTAIAVFVSWSFYQLFHFIKIGQHRARLGALAAFTSRYSYRQGEAVPLFVHTTGDAVARLFRLGAAREPGDFQLTLQRQLQSNRYDRWRGCSWQPVTEVSTEGLKPGQYVIEIQQTERNGTVFSVPIIITPNDPAPVAVVASTNDWEAHNAFGGISKYENHRFNWLVRRAVGFAQFKLSVQLPNVALPHARPNLPLSRDISGHDDPLAEHHSRFLRAEWSTLAFLEREGFPYAVYGSRDLAFSESPLAAKLMILHGHCEYWSPEMFHNLQRFIDRGGKVLVSGGNPLFGFTELKHDGLLVSFKDNDRSYVSSLVGAYYTGGRDDAAPYRVLRPDHWVFAGTGLQDGDLFGQYSANLPPARFGGVGLDGSLLRAERRPAGEGGQTGASGLFTTQFGMGSGKFIKLAEGLNPEYPAHMVYQDTDAGGWVCNTASLAFTGALGHDSIVTRMTKNLIGNALGDPHD